MGIFKSVNKQNIRAVIKTAVSFVLNPKLLICFALAWMITNGWAYVMLGFGFYLDISWMQLVAGTYLGLIWIPMTPEKIITVAISIFLLRLFFPGDQKTLGVLLRLKDSAVKALQKRKKSKDSSTDQSSSTEDSNK